MHFHVMEEDEKGDPSANIESARRTELPVVVDYIYHSNAQVPPTGSCIPFQDPQIQLTLEGPNRRDGL